MRNIFLILLGFSRLSLAQTYTGLVKDETNQGIPGVTVFWKSKMNQAVISNESGDFTIPKSAADTWLFLRHPSYKQDSFLIEGNEGRKIFLLHQLNLDLEAVTVKAKSTFIEKLNPIFTEVISTKELAKAACCNLSESFETNGSVSVGFADAITGSKQIQLLGLSGIYVQTNVENLPFVRGLAVPFGLNFIPGTWIQGIDLAKGSGSVLNGYENITGAINIELKKPDQSERTLLNAYVNSFGRGEVNFNYSKRKDKGWSYGLLSHGSFLQTNIDQNNDSFLDLPKYGQLNILSRWKYKDEKKVFQIGLKYLFEDRLGGQQGFTDRISTSNLYGFTNQTSRPELFMKIAKLYQSKPYKGLGFIFHTVLHRSDSYFGFKPYLATQKTIYGNLIYQNIIGNTDHTYKTGLSFLNDNYDETLGGLKLARNEVVPGGFFEYTLNKRDKTVLLLGSRLDYHNMFGLKFMPRLHFKQDISQSQTLRLSLGRGYRVPNFFADNYGYLVSNRVVKILDKLQTEICWTYGGSYLIEKGKLSINTEYYINNFENQLVADTEHGGNLYYYFSEGKSITKSAMMEVKYNYSSQLEFKLAYRNVDSKLTMGKPYLEKVYLPRMFLAKDRVLFNVAYALPYDKWKTDFTWQWNGRRRIADVSKPHASYGEINELMAPDFSNINAQITRNFTKFEWYIGGENLGNFRQKNPIIAANDPFGSKFDAGMTWGPITGALVYSGFRYKIK